MVALQFGVEIFDSEIDFVLVEEVDEVVTRDGVCFVGEGFEDGLEEGSGCIVLFELIWMQSMAVSP